MTARLRLVWLVLVSFLLMSAPLSAAQQVPAANPAAGPSSASVPHPVALPANTPASTCLECHGDLAKGKYVHSALEAGCTTCHSIQTRDGVTRVMLLAPPEKLCESCHALSTDKVLHGPYREGLCVTCHSPHSSNFPNHTWASSQDICLGCHARQRLKVDAKARTVIMPWGKTLPMPDMKGWMYLNLNRTLTANHPVQNHPVSGPNRKPNLPPLSCESCHKVHAGNYKNLLTVGPTKEMPLCATCGLCQRCHENLF